MKIHPMYLPKPVFKMTAITPRRDKNPNCGACRNAETKLVGGLWALVCGSGLACRADAKECEQFHDARRTSREGLLGMA